MKLSFLLVFILTILTYLFYPIYGLENDTFYQSVLSNGYFNSNPSPYLMFSNYYFGLGVNFLELISPSINWHSIILFITLILSISYMFNNLYFSLKLNKKHSLLFFVVFVMLFTLPIINVSFTLVAVISCLAGLSYFYLEFENKSFVKSKRLYISLGFIVLSALIRFEAMLYTGLLLSGPFFFKILISKYDKRVLFFRLFIVSAIILTTTLTLELLSIRSYNENPNWEHFLDFNKKRAAFYDYSNSFEGGTNDFNIKVNKDASLISQSFHYHKDLLDINNIPTNTNKSKKSFELEKIFHFAKDFLLDIVISKEFLFIVLLLVSFKLYGQINLIFVLSSIFYVGVIYVTTSLIFKQVGFRLHYGIFLVLMLIVLELFKNTSITKPNLLFTWSLVFLFGYSVMETYASSTTRKYRAQGISQEMRSLFSDSSKTYFSHGSALPFEWLSPFSNKDYLENANLIPGTYLTTVHPWFHQINNGEFNLLKDDLYYISHNFIWNKEMIEKSKNHPLEIKNYIEYKYDVEVKIKKIKKENRFKVVRFVTQKN